MDESKIFSVGDEVYNRFDESLKPFIILKVEDETARPNRIWVLTVDKTNGTIIFDNTIWLEKTGRQYTIDPDVTEELERILESDEPVYKLPKKLLGKGKIDLI